MERNCKTFSTPFVLGLFPCSLPVVLLTTGFFDFLLVAPWLPTIPMSDPSSSLLDTKSQETRVYIRNCIQYILTPTSFSWTFSYLQLSSLYFFDVILLQYTIYKVGFLIFLPKYSPIHLQRKLDHLQAYHYKTTHSSVLQHHLHPHAQRKIHAFILLQYLRY